ncbi:hypothetical protein H4R35_004710 [Dimargaris xerosporica]|nr:hypothetical protein H4R35_004710 [Dimargaris xerosporica]
MEDQTGIKWENEDGASSSGGTARPALVMPNGPRPGQETGEAIVAQLKNRDILGVAEIVKDGYFEAMEPNAPDFFSNHRFRFNGMMVNIFNSGFCRLASAINDFSYQAEAKKPAAAQYLANVLLTMLNHHGQLVKQSGPVDADKLNAFKQNPKLLWDHLASICPELKQR